MIRDFQDREGVLIFDSQLNESDLSYDSHHLDRLAVAEPVHFWFKHRRDHICRLFNRFVAKDARILEIGGGTGFVAAALAKEGFGVELSDVHANGLCYSKKRGINKLYQFDLFQPPFAEEFDVVCLFDVLEHLHDAAEAVRCLKSMLKPGGLLILSVPAHQWLWSRDDVIAGHFERYNKKKLDEIFHICGVKRLYMRYFFLIILPFLLLRRWLKKDCGSPVKTSEKVELEIHPLANCVLDYLTRAEGVLGHCLPNWAGGSLFAIAQKPLKEES